MENVSLEKPKSKFLSNPYIWGFTTYFAEGLPYTIIRTVSSVFFRDLKVSLQGIGLTSLYGLPWIVKFLWGPQVDQFGTKRVWMLVMQILLAIMMLITAFLAPLAIGVKVIAVLLFIGAFIASTHDISIDGYYMEALDKAGQAKYLGYRVMAYRIAMMTGTGVIVTIGTTISWRFAFLIAGALMLLLFAYHFFFLPKCETSKRALSIFFKSLIKFKFLGTLFIVAAAVLSLRYFTESNFYAEYKNLHPVMKVFNFPNLISIGLLLGLALVGIFRKKIKNFITRDPNSFYSKAFISYMEQDKIGIILAFIILLRAGEFMLSSMVSPFIVDVGIKVHYGWIASAIGLPCSIVGALFGGYMISKFTLKKVLWPFLLAQNLTNLVYMALAFSLEAFVKINTGVAEPTPIGFTNLATVAAVHGFDQFAGGLGTSVLLIFLMRICMVEFKAAHYAIGSGLMSLSGLFAGVASGYIAAKYGYGILFGVSFLFSIPGMILVFFVPVRD